MNEGWASFFHKRILDSLELPQELHLEFLVRHNQVVRPMPGSLNPYHLGLKLWEEIERIGDDPTPEERERIGPARPAATSSSRRARSTATSSFLRRWLARAHHARARPLPLRAARATTSSSRDVADDEGWRQVKETLLKSVGMGGDPGHPRRGRRLQRRAARCSSARPRRPRPAARAGREDARATCIASGATRSCSTPRSNGKRTHLTLRRARLLGQGRRSSRRPLARRAERPWL